MSDPQDYTVGWICALPIELTAAQAFFDEHHARLADSSHDDTNDYELGRIGAHNVVVAVLPKSEHGLVSAAVVAKNMTRTFPNIRFGLMVGVGGGAPSTKHDIRLGDVVVSSRADGRGGVIQYDFGPRDQNRGFRQTGFLNQPPQVLLTALGGLESRYELEGHQLVASIEAMLDRRPRLRRKYSRPSKHTDRLYYPRVVHPAGLDECGDHCSANPFDLVDRPPRNENEDDPAIHYGLIGSANNVMKDAVLRDEIVAQEGVLCFEMEAAGLMNHFPCLVIRGICDYCDSHKNEQWQGFAAMMAAAYAKDLLSRVLPSQVQLEKLMSEAIASVAHKVDCVHEAALVNNALTSALSQDLFYQRIKQWLSAPDPSTNVNRAKSLRHQGTGSWLLQNPIFGDWLLGSQRGLWLHGLAGAGKTILSATVLDELQKNFDQVTLRFFFDFNDMTKQSLDGMLRSFALQLYQAGMGSKTHLDGLFRGCQDGRNRPNVDALADTIYKMLESQKAVFVLLDALDESSSRTEVMRWIWGITNRPELSHVRFLCTGRPEAEFVDSMPQLFGDVGCLPIDTQAVDIDICAFVGAQLRRREEFTRKKLSPVLLGLIQDKVGDNAQGMFRWAACQMDALAKCLSPTAIRETLQDLPKDLSETYRRMIQEIPDSYKPDAARLLQFMVFTHRPLTVPEANDVIATRATGFSAENRVFEETDILKYCPGLVFMTQVSDYPGRRKELHLTHLSVKQFLQQQPMCDPRAARFVITHTCLTYLEDIRGTNYPMAHYAAEAWMRHAAKAPTSSDLTKHILAFLRNEITFRRSLQFYQPDRLLGDRSGAGSRLYYACLVGLTSIVRFFLDENINVDAHIGKYGNALQAASLGGHTETVCLLLEKGANVNAQGGRCGDALRASSSKGFIETVHFLLERGANINAQSSRYGTALQAGSLGGHIEVVRLLLERDADVNAQGAKYGNALQAASYDGHTEVVRLLLERGADVNAQGGEYGHALGAASYRGHAEIVQLLLEGDAEIKAQGGLLGNALQAASCMGHVEIVQLLLERDANVNAQGGKYGNALQAASHDGHREIVRLLLERGADVDAQGGKYGNALQAALYKGYTEIVRLLLERDADVDAQGGKYGNALQATFGNIETVQLLLARGADVNAQGGLLGNPLQAASRVGNTDIVRLLLERGADVNAQGGKFGNSLQAASKNGDIETVQLLVESGADVNAQGGIFGNSLQIALAMKHEKIVRLLFRKGADVHAQGGEFGNSLQAASFMGTIGTLSLLLKKGAYVNTQGGKYGHALGAASIMGRVEIVRFLLERGANINVQSAEYGTALQAASHDGRTEVVRLLLERDADVNAQGGKYGNALQAAAHQGHVEIVRLLVQYGAEVNAQGGEYGNALQAAAWGGHAEIMQLLLEGEAEINAQGGLLGNALQAASLWGDIETVQLLLERGADVTAQGGRLGNALQGASCMGRADIVQLLLRRGAEVNAQGGRFGNALQAASVEGNTETVRVLLETGADVNAQGGEYGSAVRAASLNGNTEAVQLLLESGADNNT